jgi:hypothetical protein
MAKAKSSEVKSYAGKQKTKRPGVHSKKKASAIKQSKNYKKLYRGQGKKR